MRFSFSGSDRQVILFVVPLAVWPWDIARTAQISDGAGDPTKIVISSQHGCSQDDLGFPLEKRILWSH